MKKKYFIYCLMTICFNNIDCFSAQYTNDPSDFNKNTSGFNINTSQIDWSDKPSVELAIRFIEYERVHVNTRADIAGNILIYPALAQHYQTIAPIAIELSQN